MSLDLLTNLALTVAGLQTAGNIFFLFLFHTLFSNASMKKYSGIHLLSAILPFSNQWKIKVSEADMPLFHKMRKLSLHLIIFAFTTSALLAVILGLMVFAPIY